MWLEDNHNFSLSFIKPYILIINPEPYAFPSVHGEILCMLLNDALPHLESPSL